MSQDIGLANDSDYRTDIRDPIWDDDSLTIEVGLEPDGLDALTAHQVALLLEAWPHLEDGWAASPYFGTIREHTRAYINRLASRSAGEAQ